VVAGIVAGGITTVWFQRIWRPRLGGYTFVVTSFVPDRHMTGPEPIGRLYKLRFRLAGRTSPEFCALEIRWELTASGEGGRHQQVFGKWDDAAMPLEGHDLDRFRPELVPNTYFQPLINDRVYDIPFLFESLDRQRIDIFSGWWFGRNKGYKESAIGIARSTPIHLRLVGAGGLREHVSITVAEAIDQATAAKPAWELAPQEQLELSGRPGAHRPSAGDRWLT
jgi:hypothetical protein